MTKNKTGGKRKGKRKSEQKDGGREVFRDESIGNKIFNDLYFTLSKC